MGEKGSIIFDGKKKIKIPAILPKKVLDTTGAGDAYCAGLIYSLWQEKSLIEACVFGAKIAARNVEYVGCQQYKILDI
ncbi:MAG: PfkB family carbohydrate kinase [Patescibacteria group bacterium]